MVAHAFNSSTLRQADFRAPGQPGLQSEFQDSQGYTEKPCLKKKKKRQKKKKKKSSRLKERGLQRPKALRDAHLGNGSYLKDDWIELGRLSLAAIF